MRQVTVEGEANLGTEVAQFFESLSGLAVGANGAMSLTIKLSKFGRPISINAPALRT